MRCGLLTNYELGDLLRIWDTSPKFATRTCV